LKIKKKRNRIHPNLSPKKLLDRSPKGPFIAVVRKGKKKNSGTNWIYQDQETKIGYGHRFIGVFNKCSKGLSKAGKGNVSTYRARGKHTVNIPKFNL